ncbi:MAG: GerMN domain-containing protein [Nitrospirota bacterium]
MNNKTTWILLIIIFFLAGAAGSYLYFEKLAPAEKAAVEKTVINIPADLEDFFFIRLYHPAGNRLQTVEKRLPKRTRQLSIAEAVIEEFFKGPVDAENTGVPRNVKLLGLYKDADRILYIDLSDDFRRNFHGDALSEYLLLRGIYESLISNTQDYSDFKILVEGKEIESLGGHFYLKYTLKSLPSYDISEAAGRSDD